MEDQTNRSAESGLIALYPKEAIQSKQGIPYFYGISGATTGSQGLAMHFVEIPPGGKAEPHLHRGFETGIYVLSGRVETRYGEGLRHSVVNEAGSFLFIPPGVPHQPVNLSETAPASAIVAIASSTTASHKECGAWIIGERPAAKSSAITMIIA